MRKLNFRRHLPLERITAWLNERVFLDSLLNFLKNKTVPNHRFTFLYLFGGLTLFFFLIQIVTGALLLFYYQPTPETAHESVKNLIDRVSYGSFIRSLHIWTSQFMVASLVIHMFSVYFMKAYRRPREAMWFTGAVLMLITLGFAFTGYLLPWDVTAYFATQIGTEIPRSIPLIGNILVTLLRGGPEVDGNTLTRLFALHVFVLPLLGLIIVAAHLVLNQVHGSSRPLGIRDKGPAIPFFPNFMIWDWIAWLVAGTVLISLAFGFPWGLGSKADPMKPAPPGVRPEWYFWFVYETLRLFPSQVWIFSGEAIINTILIAVLALWFLIPVLDRKGLKEEKSHALLAAGIVAALYLVGMTVLGAVR